ncbi:DUF4097 domain-containing protein [Bacillus sp. REN10]|uniref:LiaG family protein n=1 Tax=Bacillus sp. REN10 TaxID=2782541 RepID=UPI00193AEFCD|nr:DUF4097 domain-containing protein [Bacillus sp. REN10]
MRNFLIILMIVLALGTTFFIKKEQSQGNSAEMTRRIDNIELTVDSSQTTIIAEKRDNVKAELDGKGNLTVRTSGNTIEVEMKRKWYQWFSVLKHSNLTVYIPEDYNRNLELNVGSGDVTFSGQSNSRPMKLNNMSIDMSSGDVKLANLETDSFEHDASSGKLTIDSLTTKKGMFDLSSGDVKLTRYVGPLDGELSSGDMHVEMEKLVGDVRMDLSSGDVKLDLPDKADFTLKGKMSSGDISCDFPLKDQKIDSGDISGTHGSGKYNIDVSLSSGEMKIY